MDGLHNSAEWRAGLFVMGNLCLMVSVVWEILALVAWLLYHVIHEKCVEPIDWFYTGIWSFLFILSLVGITAVRTKTPILLWIYFILWGLIGILLCIFFVMGLNVTIQKTGHRVDGLRFEEYQLQDYSSWIIKQINNSHSWEHHYKRCYVKPNCSYISETYKTREKYKLAWLEPIEAGCCRPPSECGYPAIDASYYNLSIPPTSSHKDCQLYKNSNGVKCFNCDSCKAGVAEHLKNERESYLIPIGVILVILLPLLFLGCSVRQNVERSHRNKAFVHPIVTVQTDV